MTSQILLALVKLLVVGDLAPLRVNRGLVLWPTLPTEFRMRADRRRLALKSVHVWLKEPYDE